MNKSALIPLVLSFFLSNATQSQPIDCQQASSQSAACRCSEDQGTTDQKLLRIGVRSDAAPFSYCSAFGQCETDSQNRNLTIKSGPIRAKGYDGYMVYICDEVLKQMLVGSSSAPSLLPAEICVVDVDREMEDKPIGTDRMTLLEDGAIDILCDPATISRDRVRAFASSAPLFLSGIGYLSHKGVPEPRGNEPLRGHLIGVVGTTNAIRYGVNAILTAGDWRDKRERIEAALRQQAAHPQTSPDDPDSVKPQVIWQAKSHREAAEKFCSTERDQLTYYVGDLEIITASVRRFAGCEFSSGVQRFTADRYAIFANIDYKDDWKTRILARFFEILNREVIASDSLLDHAYSAEFGTRPRSEMLDLFYWSIRGLSSP